MSKISRFIPILVVRIRLLGLAGLLMAAVSAEVQAVEPDAGPEPLLIDRAYQLASWALAIHVEQGAFTDALIDDWRASPATVRDDFSQGLATIEQMMGSLPSDVRELYRLKVEGQWIESMRKDPSGPLSTFLLRAYDAAHPPLAFGSPPLTREIADAFRQLFAFQVAEALGQPHAPVSQTDLDENAANLQARWRTMPAAQRARIASAPLMMAQLRAGWRSLPEHQRAAMRAQWRKEWDSAHRAATAAARTQERLQISPEENAKRLRQLQEQLALNHQMMRLFQGAMSARHETNMAIIHNMRPSTHIEWYGGRQYRVYSP